MPRQVVAQTAPRRRSAIATVPVVAPDSSAVTRRTAETGACATSLVAVVVVEMLAAALAMLGEGLVVVELLVVREGSAASPCHASWERPARKDIEPKTLRYICVWMYGINPGSVRIDSGRGEPQQ